MRWLALVALGFALGAACILLTVEDADSLPTTKVATCTLAGVTLPAPTCAVLR